MTQIEDVRPETLKEWMEAGQAILVDVREPDEFRFEHIGGALNIPLARVAGGALPEAQGRRIVIQCASGNRSMQACRSIPLAGGDVLYNLSGGLQEWKKAGLPVAKPAKAVLPLQRQVQVAAGGVVFAGAVLALTVHPAFALIPAAVGAGLVNAGMTGWCGLALLLAKMPWNKG